MFCKILQMLHSHLLEVQLLALRLVQVWQNNNHPSCIRSVQLAANTGSDIGLDKLIVSLFGAQTGVGVDAHTGAS